MRTAAAAAVLMGMVLAGCSTTTHTVYSPSDCTVLYDTHELYAEKVPNAYELWRCFYPVRGGGRVYVPIGVGITRTNWGGSIAVLAVVAVGGFVALGGNGSSWRTSSPSRVTRPTGSSSTTAIPWDERDLSDEAETVLRRIYPTSEKKRMKARKEAWRRLRDEGRST